MNFSIFNYMRVCEHAYVHKCAGVLNHQRYWIFLKLEIQAAVNCPTRYWEAKQQVLLIFKTPLQPLALNN